MKPFHIILLITACLLGATGHSFAELNSLRTESVPTTVQAPKLMKFIKDKENVDRTFKEQPPLVPHEVEKYAINLKENQCLECHVKQPGKDKAKSVEMDESHFIDRNGKKHDKPVGARHFCTQCHVPQVDAPPLIDSNFQAAR